MSNTIDSPNFLTFPVVLDPFSSYKNIEKLDNDSPNSTKNVGSLIAVTKNGETKDVQFFTSMVCHQIKSDDDTYGKDENTNKSGVDTTKATHPLEKIWKQSANDKYNETDDNRQARINKFHSYLTTSRDTEKYRHSIVQNIPNFSLSMNFDPLNKSNEFLLKFLRAGNHDIDYAAKILANYIQESYTSAKYSKNAVNIDVMKRVYKEQIHIMLQHRDKYGRRVYIWRPGRWNPDKVNICDCYCAGYMLCEMVAREPMTQICGCTVITDAENFGFKQFKQFTIQDIKCFSTFMQDTFPLWFHQIHVVNAPRIFNMLYGMAKPFLHQRTTEAIIFHEDYKSLHKYVDRKILPKEYGGDIGPFDNTPCASAVYNMAEFYVQVKKYVHQFH